LSSRRARIGAVEENESSRREAFRMNPSSEVPGTSGLEYPGSHGFNSDRRCGEPNSSAETFQTSGRFVTWLRWFEIGGEAKACKGYGLPVRSFLSCSTTRLAVWLSWWAVVSLAGL